MRIVLPIITIILCVLLKLQAHWSSARSDGLLADDGTRRTFGFIASTIYGDLTPFDAELANGDLDLDELDRKVREPVEGLTRLTTAD